MSRQRSKGGGEPAPDEPPSGAEGCGAELAAKLAALPDAPGVYLHKNRQGKVIYVGKAARLSARVRSYFQGGAHDAKTSALVTRIADFDFIATADEVEALVLEDQLIKEYRPRYNVRLKDDKHYPYLKITLQEAFPRVLVVRRILADGARYFGPYTDTRAMRETLKFAAGFFGVRTCHLDLPRQSVPRPCLDYQIGRCPAPCVSYEDQALYRRRVRQLVLFLEGADRRLQAGLRAEMARLSRARRYEEAAQVRNRLARLDKTAGRALAAAGVRGDLDACGLVRDGAAACGVILRVRGGRVLTVHEFQLTDRLERGAAAALPQLLREYYPRAGEIPAEVLVPHELPDRAAWEVWLAGRRGGTVRLRRPRRGAKLALLQMATANATFKLNRASALGGGRARRLTPAHVQLQEALGLPVAPATIECFDISSFQGREAVGALVYFRDGQPLKSRYRRFRLRGPERSDDYAMLREVLTRHCARLAAAGGGPADLVMVDGGAGQLGVAREVLAAYGFHDSAAVGLAKAEELVYRERGEPPLALPAHSPARLLLQRVRDEAHRFALTYHRLLRDRRTRASELDLIPGVGPMKKLALLHHFGSAAAVRAAGSAELAAVRGLTARDVERILAYFAARREGP